MNSEILNGILQTIRNHSVTSLYGKNPEHKFKGIAEKGYLSLAKDLEQLLIMEMRSEGTRATICFNGDRSVGMFPRHYQMELPVTLEKEDSRDEIRKLIKDLYEDIDQDERCHVMFDDESDED